MPAELQTAVQDAERGATRSMTATSRRRPRVTRPWSAPIATVHEAVKDHCSGTYRAVAVMPPSAPKDRIVIYDIGEAPRVRGHHGGPPLSRGDDARRQGRTAGRALDHGLRHPAARRGQCYDAEHHHSRSVADAERVPRLPQPDVRQPLRGGEPGSGTGSSSTARSAISGGRSAAIRSGSCCSSAAPYLEKADRESIGGAMTRLRWLWCVCGCKSADAAVHPRDGGGFPHPRRALYAHRCIRRAGASMGAGVPAGWTSAGHGAAGPLADSRDGWALVRTPRQSA